jgi:glycosyltransferase involved in cell wall biosynthesis
MDPLVSCITVSRPSPERLPHLKRSIGYYERQTYRHRELVIVLDDGPELAKTAVDEHVRALGRSDVRVVHAPPGLSLGKLRNFAMECKRGDLIALWDDDDIHHPMRIEQQVNALRKSGGIATFLSEVLQLFVRTGEVYLTNYRNSLQKCLPGTGLLLGTVSARYPEMGPESRIGEDTAFCLRLLEEGRVLMVDDAPHLYVYVSHGSNTSGDAHHDMLARTLGVTRARILRRESEVRDALEHAELDLPEIVVRGTNGVAFTWARSARP